MRGGWELEPGGPFATSDSWLAPRSLGLPGAAPSFPSVSFADLTPVDQEMILGEGLTRLLPRALWHCPRLPGRSLLGASAGLESGLVGPSPAGRGRGHPGLWSDLGVHMFGRFAFGTKGQTHHLKSPRSSREACGSWASRRPFCSTPESQSLGLHPARSWGSWAMRLSGVTAAVALASAIKQVGGPLPGHSTQGSILSLLPGLPGRARCDAV